MVASGFGALSGGITADFFGRRLSLGISLTLYGISTVLGGLFQNLGIVFFMYFVNGINWGILWTIYGSVVWGDLSSKESCAKRYALGLMIFYIISSAGVIFTTEIAQVPLIVSSLVGCFLIFLSNIPIVLAPELLASDFLERIRLKMHLRTLIKIRKRQRNQG